MKYIIWNKNNKPLTADVAKEENDYFKTHILPNLSVINQQQYVDGFSAILHSYARWSYILNNQTVYWLIEWDPGLLVLELTTEEVMRFTALRSPVPNFGKREPLPIDNEDDFDEDAENHQYNLIFDAWDAQFDERLQQWKHFSPALESEVNSFHNCLNYANKLGDIAQSTHQHDFKNYYEQAKQNIAEWAGIGIVVKKTSNKQLNNDDEQLTNRTL